MREGIFEKSPSLKLSPQKLFLWNKKEKDSMSVSSENGNRFNGTPWTSSPTDMDGKGKPP